LSRSEETAYTSYSHMEHPEDALERGLTWPRFQSEYSRVRRGASKREVSSAWTRYKAEQVTVRPSLDTEEEAVEAVVEVRRPPIRAEEPVQSLTAAEAASLGHLPEPLLVHVARQDLGAARVLARLSRRIYLAVDDVIDEFRETAEISVCEVRRYLTRRLLERRDRGTFLAYVAIRGTTGFSHAYSLEMGRDRLEVTSRRTRVTLHEGEPLVHVERARHGMKGVVAQIVARLRVYRDASCLLFDERTVEEVLRGRGGVEVSGEWYQVSRAHAYMDSLRYPRLLEYMQLGRRTYDPKADRILAAEVLADEEDGPRVALAVFVVGSLYRPLGDYAVAALTQEDRLAAFLRMVRRYVGVDLEVDDDTLTTFAEEEVDDSLGSEGSADWEEDSVE
jgi:hypothetical protein